MRFLLVLNLLVAAAATAVPSFSHFNRRDEVCSDLSVSSNNGDRKVALVIDSSPSMRTNDPQNLRLAASTALVDFLISNSEASGGKKADQVTVIDFDDSARVDYPLGDPAGASSAVNNITLGSGTYIASGVRAAITQLSSSSAGSTDKRSAIVVLTDGEDENTQQLLGAINDATAAGIRVSFGYLDTSVSSQPPLVLQAIRNSRGVYATITKAAGSINFINYVLLNGLTYNDNSQGYSDQLLSGLAQTHQISGSSNVTLKYNAQQGERVNFTVTSITAPILSVVAQMGGQILPSALTGGRVAVTAPNTGEMQLLVGASNAPADSLFSVTTNSDVPIKNCTVRVVDDGGNSGMSTGARIGLGVGLTIGLLGLFGAAGYFAWKHWPQGWTWSGAFGSGNAPMTGGANAPMSGPGGGNATMVDAGSGLGQGTLAAFDPGAEKMLPYTQVHPLTPPAVQSPTPAIPAGPGVPVAPVAPASPGDQAAMSWMSSGQASMAAASQGLASTMAASGGQTLMAMPSAGAASLPSYAAPITFALPSLLPPKPGKPKGSPEDDISQTSSVSATSQSSFPVTTTSSAQHVMVHPGAAPGQNQIPMPGHGNNPSAHMPPRVVDPSTPSSPEGTQAGFTMPGVQMRQHGREKKHHHHTWLAPDTACEHPDCPLSAQSHACTPDKTLCPCTCRIPDCPVGQRA